MEKEIHEQPEVISHTLANYLDFTQGHVRSRSTCRSISPTSTGWRVSACGTAYLCRSDRQILVRAPLRGCRSISMSPRNSVTAKCRLSKKSLAFFVSQSGETADTLASLRYCRKAG
jgi:glucosamine--fructose-6-phosphate aminotransferase (isomerizing)